MEVWSENWNTLQAFLACATQWRVALGLAGSAHIGIGYSDLDPILDRFAGMVRGSSRQKARAVHRRSTLFDELRLMEHAALDVFGKEGV